MPLSRRLTWWIALLFTAVFGLVGGPRRAEAFAAKLFVAGATAHTAYVFPSYTLRRAATTGTGAATDYVQSASTEEVRLEAGGEAVGRVLVSTADLSATAVTGQRVLLTLGDHLGSTSTVIDRETGELVEAVGYTAYGQTESDVRPDRYKGLREDVRFTGNEDDVEVGLTAFAKRYYAPALGRWASPDPLAVHAPGEADLNLYAYVHGRVYAATDPLGLEGLETMADGMLHQAMNAGQQAAANEFSKGVLETSAKAVVAGAICTQYAPLCVGAAAVRLATEGVDHDAAGKVLLQEAPALAAARFATRGRAGAPSRAIVEKEIAATAPVAPVAPLGEAAGGGRARFEPPT
jgi:RHS repeat-associated protein